MACEGVRVFSGIIDGVGEVCTVAKVPGGVALSIRATGYWVDVMPGASVAIDGVCLTVTRIEDDVACFDVVAETLRRTTLGELRAGGRVNLQKSLRVGDRVDGHFVQGHVDAIGVVSRVESSAAESKWWVRVGGGALPCMVPKGSVAIDGISLTIADVCGDEFSVALIPMTLERTTIGSKQVGAKVNLETDIVARTVIHQLKAMTPGLAR